MNLLQALYELTKYNAEKTEKLIYKILAIYNLCILYRRVQIQNNVIVTC